MRLFLEKKALTIRAKSHGYSLHFLGHVDCESSHQSQTGNIMVPLCFSGDTSLC